MSDFGFEPEDDLGFQADPDPAEQEGATNAQLATIRETAISKDPSRFTEALSLAGRLGARVDIVDANLDAFRSAAEAADFNPIAFRKDNPHLANMLLEDPETLAPLVMREEQLSPFTRFRRSQNPWLVAEMAIAGKTPDETRAAIDAQNAEPSVTRMVPTVDAPEARNTGVDRAAIYPAEWKRARKESQLNSLYARKVMAMATGVDVALLDEEIGALEKEVGGPQQHYGQGPVEQFFLHGVQGVASNIDPIVGAVRGYGIAGSAAGVVTLGVTKNPAMASAAASAVGGIGAKAGMFLASAEQETGSAFREFSRLKTDDGQPLDPSLAAGMAVVYGALSAGVEVATLDPFLGGLGSIGAAIKAGQGRAFLAEAVKNKTTRKIIMDAAAAIGRGAKTEGVEEAVQQSLQIGVGHLAKVEQAGASQKFDTEAAVDQVTEAAWQGAVGGVFLGTPTTAVNVAMQLRARAQADRGGQQLAAIAELAATPTAKAAPQQVAELIRRETAETGEAVTHVYVDATKFTKLFQDNNADAEEAATQLLGESGPQILQEALATGEKIEIPVQTYLERWGGTDIAQALQEHTTSHPLTLSAAEAKEFDTEIEERAKEIAAAFEKNAAEESTPEADAAYIAEVRKNLAASGKYDARTVDALIQIHEQYTRAQGAAFGKAPAELFESMALAVRAGEGQATEGALEQPAFHGTPHRGIEKFSLQKIGTGEGAQAYGWGLYFAGNKEVAEHYRKELSKPQIQVDGADAGSLDLTDSQRDALSGVEGRMQSDDAPPLSEVIASQRTMYEERLAHDQRTIAELEKQRDANPDAKDSWQKSIDDRVEGLSVTREQMAFLDRLTSLDGQLYKVEVPEGDRLLDYDKPLSEQPEKVKTAIAPLVERLGLVSAEKGASLYQALTAEAGGPQAASEALRAAGIPGLRYLDGSSRDSGEGSHNYVLWDEEQVDIKETFYQENEADNAEPESHKALRANIPSLSREQKGRAVFIDRTTGLLNQRAFEAIPPPADKPLVAIVSVPGVKAINDDPTHGGHNKANGLFRMAAKALARAGDAVGVTPFKVGGDFRFYVRDEAELMALVQQANELMPVKGLDMVGVAGESIQVAADKRIQTLDRLRAEGAFPNRGQIPAALKGKLGETVFPEEMANTPVPAELQERVAALNADAFFSEAYVEESGALTREGWDALPRKAHVVSIDMSGLGLANDRLGKLFGDQLLDAFTFAAMDAGGQGFDFAHLSGDEFAAQSDDPDALKSFVASLEREAEISAIVGELPSGGIVVYDGIQFWNGVGTDYDHADRQLNAQKRVRQKAGEVRGGEDRIKRYAAGREADEGRALYAGRARAQLRREGNERGTESSDRGAPSLQVDPKKKLNQGAAKDLGVEPRGFVELAREGTRRIFNIVLNPKADVSTFLHESGHVFLEMQGDLAARPDAPARVKEDYAAVLKHLGVDRREDIQREHHEKFARSFEAYLYEGRAPSLTLVRAFERFKNWLKRIYRSIESLDAPLNDEIRGVFDRLLATDQEIERVRGTSGLHPLFRSPAEAGMTADEWGAYLDLQEKAAGHAARAAEVRVLKDQLREKQSWWKAEEAKLREDFAAAYEARPEVRAWKFLRHGDPGDHAGLQAVIGEERDAALARGEAKVPKDISRKIERTKKQIGELQHSMAKASTHLVVTDEDGVLGFEPFRGEAPAQGEVRALSLPSWLSPDGYLENRPAWEWTWSALAQGQEAPEQAQRLVFQYFAAAHDAFPGPNEFALKQGYAAARLIDGKGGKKFAYLRDRIDAWMVEPESTRAVDPIPEAVWGALINTTQKDTQYVSTAKFVNRKRVDTLDRWLAATSSDLDTSRENYLRAPPVWLGGVVAVEDAAKAARAPADPKSAKLDALRVELDSLDEKAAEAAAAGLSARPKLDDKAVADALGKKALGRFRGLTVATGGLHPDTLAELLEVGSGAELLQKMVAPAPIRAEWTREQAAVAMAERYPDILQERDRLQEVVAKGLHSDHTAGWLLKEWTALRSRTQQGPGGVPLEAVKRAARIIGDRSKVRRLDAHRAMQAERSAAEGAFKAAARKNYAKALVLKEQQLLNHFIYRELSEARDDRDAFLDLAAKLQKPEQRARLGKASPAYRDGVDGLLEALRLKNPEERERPLASVGEVIATMEANGQTIGFDQSLVEGILAKPRDYRELSVAEMREVASVLASLKKAATNLNTVLFEGRRVEKAAIVQELVAEASANLPDQGPPVSSVGAMSFIERGASMFSGLDGNLLKPEVMLSWLGGRNLSSTWFKAIVEPLQKAKHREADLLKKTVQPVIDAFLAIPKNVQRRLQDKVDGASLFPNHRPDLQPPSRRFELIMMALHFGTDSSRERLLEGRNITEAEVVAALDLLTKEEMAWVQSVWDAADSLWPESSALEERDTGLVPKKLKLAPVTTKAGTFRGGYFPAIYDRRVEAQGERQQAQTIADLMDPTYTRPGTSKSHLKTRAQNFAGALSLDPGLITSSLAQVAHDIAYREAVKSVGSLILAPEVQQTLKRHLGDERGSLFLQWVKDVGQMRGTQMSTHATTFNRLFQSFKSNAAISALGYSVSVAMGDISNLAVSATVLKKKHWAAALGDFFAHPVKMRAFALEKSGELRYRDDESTRMFDTAVKQLTAQGVRNSGVIGAIRRNAFVLMEWTDRYTSTPTWLGAYRQALAEGKGETDAVTFADATVRQLFPSHAAVDRSAIIRDKGFWGSSLMFYGYMNVLYNRQRDIVHDLYLAANDGDTTGGAAVSVAKEMPRVAGQLLALYIASNVFAELLSGRGAEEEEEPEEWFLRKLLLAPFSTLPFIGGPIESLALDKKPSIRNAPIFSAVEAVGKAAQKALSDGDTDDQVLAVLRGLGVTFGIPSPPIRAADYVRQAVEGEADADPLAAASGLIYGKRDKQPKNPFTLIRGE